MSNIPNPEIDLAFEYIQNTNKHIFLTGKAGTGKTTFLHRVKSTIDKRKVVVAPTGVAAINAKGMTIHSFFQLPFGPFLPDNPQDPSRQRRFNSDKLDLIRALDLLIIDEISMVRADLLDSIDDVLRRYKDGSKPFGGVQLLMIGDLHQLPPVVKRDEWDLLSPYYQTPYFFGSLALQKTDCITIELKHIYRQSDDIFIKLLNKVRNNQVDNETLQLINSRYKPNFQPTEEEPYITLTSHNASAKRINEGQLNSIKSNLYKYNAAITGDFPKHLYPTDENLEVKVGAQVVFIKNDTSFEKRYYNGKIGKIINIDEENIIYVKCPNETSPIPVKMATWDNVKYDLDKGSKEVSEEIVGTFKHYPLKLAWAITIHKSQGLTFDRAIIDAQAAFAHGQVYVALSRCRSFEGIVLLSKINHRSVRTDSVVKNYSDQSAQNPPTKDHLEIAKRDYQQALMRELFSFQLLKGNLEGVKRAIWQDEDKFVTSPLSQYEAFSEEFEKEILVIAQKFQPQLERYFSQTALPEEHEKLMSRIQKAGAYFSDLLKKKYLPELQKIPIFTDNAAVKKRVEGRMEELGKRIFVKAACFEAMQTGFSIKKYIKAKANGDLEYDAYLRKSAVNSIIKQVPQGTKHPELYAQLLQWRKEEAESRGVMLYEVIPTKTIAELALQLPTNTDDLLKIKGIGRVKARMHGKGIVHLIEMYCEEKGISREFDIFHTPKPISKPKTKKSETKTISFEMFKTGKSTEEIAQARNLTINTIEGHLAHFIETGELAITEVMLESAVEDLAAFFKKNEEAGKSVAKAHFGDKYSYGEIGMVLAHLKGAST